MKTIKIFIYTALLALFANSAIWALPTFTDNFVNTTYIETGLASTGVRSGNSLINGYPAINAARSWAGRWGDMVYYNGYIYITWSDNRYNGVYGVYVQKLNAATGTSVWTMDFQVEGETNQATYPSISVYNSSTIYVAYGVNIGGLKYIYAAKIDDSGASPTLATAWGGDKYTGLDNVKWNHQQTATTVDAVGNLYIYAIGNYTGSWNNEYLQKVDTTGTVRWGTTGYQNGLQYNFTYAGDIDYMRDSVYISGHNFNWGNLNDVVYANRILTNNTISRRWGNYTNLGGYTRTGQLTGNSMYNAVYTVKTNGNLLYFVWAEKNNNNYTDIWMKRVDTNGANVTWADKVAIATTANRYEEDVDVAVDFWGSPWVVYIDYSDSFALKLLKINESTGEVSATNTLNGLKPSAGATIYHPTIQIESNQIYLSFYTTANNAQLRVARLDTDAAGNLTTVWVNNDVQSVAFKLMATTLSRSIVFSGTDLVGSVKRVTLNANMTGGGNTNSIKFYVSPNNIDFFEAPTNVAVELTNASGDLVIGADFRVKIVMESNGSLVRLSNYTVEISDFFTGNFIYGTNFDNFSMGLTTLSGNPNLQVVTKKVMANGVNKNIVYLSLTNQGNSGGRFYLSASTGAVGWTVRYYFRDTSNNTNDITSLITSAEGYEITDLPSLGNTNFWVEVTPLTSTVDGEEYNVYIYALALKGGAPHDSITVKTIAQKFSTDIAVLRDASYVGWYVSETTPVTQTNNAILNARFSGYEEWVTNIFAVSNAGVTNQTVHISNWTVGTPSHWTVVFTNLTKGGASLTMPYLLNLTNNEVNEIGVIVRPNSSVVAVNETFDIGLYFRVTNGIAFTDSLRQDSAMFYYRAIKVQPDLRVSLTPDHIISRVNDDYTYTNAAVDQTLTQKTVYNKEIYYFIRLENDGLMSENIKIYANRITNLHWQENYTMGGVPIISQLTNFLTNAAGEVTNGGIWINLGAGQSTNIICSYKPTNESIETGDTPNISFVAFSSNKPFVKDIITIRPRCFKVFPDVMVSTNNVTYITNNNPTTAPNYATSSNNVEGQFYYIRSEHMEVRTNFFKIQNDSPYDSDFMYVKGTAGDTFWSISYWTTNSSGTWIDITGLMTNTGYSNTNMTVAEEMIFRVIYNPNPSAIVDSVRNIVIHTWSDWVNTQTDFAMFSNIVVELRPRLIINNFDDMNNYTATYEAGSNGVRIIAGHDYSYDLVVSNVGGSLENYRLLITPEIVGGQLSDWAFSISNTDNTVDITTDVTNAGVVYALSAYQKKNLKINIRVTNLASVDSNSTRGAVSNKLVLKMDWKSETKPTRVDKGMLDVMIMRGVPDLIIGNTNRGEFFSTYNTSNYTSFGAVPKYESLFTIKVFNNHEKQALTNDDFILLASFSNAIGASPANWMWRYYDQSMNDITALITNTNAGFEITDLEKGAEYNIYLWVVNSNGAVGNRADFRYELRSKFKEVRKDLGWHNVDLVLGLPDAVVIHNNTTNGFTQQNGELLFSKHMEIAETNHYRIILSNSADGEGYPLFIFKELPGAGNYANIEYRTNGVLIPRSVFLDGIFTNFIRNRGSTNTNNKEVRVDVYVILTNGSSGNAFQWNYRMYLDENNAVYDEFALRTTVVNPSVDIFFAGYTTNHYKVYKKPSETNSVEVRIQNTDVVQGDFNIRSSNGNASVGFQFYELVGSIENLNTALVTNLGWVTNVLPSQYSRIKVEGVVSPTAISGSRYMNRIWARSVKNTNRTDYIDYEIEVVAAKADISISGNGLSVGENQYYNPSVLQAATNKIEYNETNTFTLKIDNDKASGSNVNFIVREAPVPQNMQHYIVDYLYGGNPITMPFSNISLAAGQSTNIQVRVVFTNNTGSPLPEGWINYELYTADVAGVGDLTGFYDSVNLYQRSVKPRLYLAFEDTTTIKSNYIQPNQSTIIKFDIQNEDNYSGSFVIRGTAGDAIKKLSYLHITFGGLVTNNITTSVTNVAGYTMDIANGATEKILMLYEIGTNATSGDFLNSVVRVHSTKNTNVLKAITNFIEVIDARPDLSVFNLLASTNVVGYANYSSDQRLRDKIIVGTNNYFMRIRNNLVAGGVVKFRVSEDYRSDVLSNNYIVEYFDTTNGTNINLANYQVNLSAGQETNIMVRLILTNSNLQSGREGYVRLKQSCVDIPTLYDELYIYSKKLQPAVYLRFSDNSTNLEGFVLKSESRPVYVVFANHDPSNYTSIYFKASGNQKDYSYEYLFIENNVTNNITAQITNTGWESPLLAPSNNKTIIVNTRSDPNSGTGSYVSNLIRAYPMDDTNYIRTVNYKIEVINSVVDVVMKGGHIADYGEDIYLPERLSNVDRVEYGETNVYVLQIQNDDSPTGPTVPIKVYPTFSGNVSEFSVSYTTNNIPINISNCVVSLQGGTYQDIEIRVTPISNIDSAKYIDMDFTVEVTNMTIFQDNVQLTVKKTTPFPELSVAGPMDRVWKIDSYKNTGRTFKTLKGVAYSYYLAIKNSDKIWDDYRIYSTITISNDIEANWNISYTPFNNLNPAKHTTYGTDDKLPMNTGFVLSNMDYNNYFTIKVNVVPEETASPDVMLQVVTYAVSLKNSNIVDTITNTIMVAAGGYQGYLTDKKDGSPLSNAIVTVLDSYGSKSVGRSEEDGFYFINVYPLYNSRFSLTVEKEGYIGMATNVIYQTGDNVVDFNLVGMNMEGITETYVRAFPNPTGVGKGATFTYKVENNNSTVRVEIYNLNGGLVRKLVNETKTAGNYYIAWDGNDETGKVVERGIYLFFISENEKTSIKKLFIK